MVEICIDSISIMVNVNDCLLNKLINQQLDKEIEGIDRNVSEEHGQLFDDDLQKRDFRESFQKENV